MTSFTKPVSFFEVDLHLIFKTRVLRGRGRGRGRQGKSSIQIRGSEWVF